MQSVHQHALPLLHNLLSLSLSLSLRGRERDRQRKTERETVSVSLSLSFSLSLIYRQTLSLIFYFAIQQAIYYFCLTSTLCLPLSYYMCTYTDLIIRTSSAIQLAISLRQDEWLCIPSILLQQ